MGESGAFVSLADLLVSRPVGPEPSAPQAPRPKALRPQALRPQAFPADVPHSSGPVLDQPPPETAPFEETLLEPAASHAAGPHPGATHLVPDGSEDGRLPRSPAPSADAPPDDPSGVVPPLAAGVPLAASYELFGHPSALREARIFRAAVADALDVRLAELVRALAAKVLSRELLLAPADIELVARALIAEHLADGPLRLRVAPADAAFSFELAVVADPRLQRGDAILECRDGDIDARLHVRLEQVIRGVRS